MKTIRLKIRTLVLILETAGFDGMVFKNSDLKKASHHIFLNRAFLIILGSLLFSSCEKIIDVDLNDADPTIVIEGNLSMESGTLEVKLSQTGSYFDAEPLKRIENAEVILRGGPGYNVKARNTRNGLYYLNNLPLHSGQTYMLDVTIEGSEYHAYSTLHPHVNIDSLDYEYQREEPFIEGGYRLLLYMKDPPDTENFYRVKLFKNNITVEGQNNIIIFDDSRLDGKGIRVRLGSHSFDIGDTVRVELHTIDENVWEYFRGLRDVLSLNPGSPAPANPVSNISNGALGYFSASSSTSREIIIK